MGANVQGLAGPQAALQRFARQRKAERAGEHFGEQGQKRGGEHQASPSGSSPSISLGGAMTMRPPLRSISTATALVKGSRRVYPPAGGAISRMSPAPKLRSATTRPSRSPSRDKASRPTRSS